MVRAPLGRVNDWALTNNPDNVVDLIKLPRMAYLKPYFPFLHPEL
jgi:hypothetical protein